MGAVGVVTLAGCRHSWGSMSTKNSLPENQTLVNPESLGGSPSLDYISKSGASREYNSRQKMCYGRAVSWMTEARGRGLQLFWVMLSSSPESDSSMMMEHFQELRRRIKRVYRYDIEFFRVKTSEGFGVLHMIWGIKSERAAKVDQHWLSDEWQKIHAAKIVWIERIGKGGHDIKGVSRYICSHYLAGQGSFDRMSWSWWKAKFAIVSMWREFKRRWRDFEEKDFGVSTVMARYGKGCSKARKYRKWAELLVDGACEVAGMLLIVVGRDHLQVMPADAGAYE